MSIFPCLKQSTQPAAPIPPPAPKLVIPEPIKVEPITPGISSLTVLGYTAPWNKEADPYAAAWFKTHPLYGRDVKLPYYVMKHWDDNVDARELPGYQRNNAFVVWALKNFTWLDKKYFVDETAWCKAVWNAACETAGFKVGDSAMALDGVKEGISVPADDAQLGDFLVLFHLDSNGNYNGKHHITFFEKYGESHVYGRGGNQGNDLNVSQWSKRELKANSVRRLTLKQSVIAEVRASA